jgi:hypothetical protein
MRQATLLILNRTDMALIRTEQAILEIRNQRTELEVEDTANQLRSVRGLLAREEVTDDLRPPRVGCKGNKEGRLTKVLYNHYRVLKQLLYIMITTCKRGREDYTAANISCTDILTE